MQSAGFIQNVIRDCLAECRTLIAGRGVLPHIQKAFTRVEAHLYEPMQLAIVGRLSSSKSTLVNAIIGAKDFVSTGHGAVTFNVSWIKYGDKNAPIVVHFKDGSKRYVARDQWEEWASHAGNETLKTQVSYIEVTTDHEVLKQINIIDTPGLDAPDRIDSQNTIDFLQLVNPDAVVLIFSKSLTADALQLIRDFQIAEHEFSFSVNPMNALGVLSKVDMNWKFGEKEDIIEKSQRSIDRTLSSRSDVSKVLFNILPISAQMGLAATLLQGDDLADLRHLSHLPEAKKRLLLCSPSFFAAKYDWMELSQERREALVGRFTLYGLHLLLEALQAKPQTSISELAALLRQRSGFEYFLQLLISHFGDRAQLIKVQRAVLSILEAAQRDRQEAKTEEEIDSIGAVELRIRSLADELHELKEWAFLLKIYESKIEVEEELFKEFLRMSGESGHAVIDKLNLSSAVSIEEMESVAMAHSRKWRIKYNAYARFAPRRAEPYAIISKSYELLLRRLREQRDSYMKAQKMLKIFNHYIYGKREL